jgi:uncharacterized Zn finger protein
VVKKEMKAICDFCGKEEETTINVIVRKNRDPRLKYRCGSCNAKLAHDYFENIKLGEKK